jgi:hypothetical protein
MRRLLFFYFFIFTIILHVDAAPLKKMPLKSPAVKKVEHIIVDSSKLSLHQYNADSLKNYRNSPDFTYQEKATAGVSWWDRFWWWFWDWINSLFGGRQVDTQPSIPYMQYIIAFALLVTLIFVIFKLAGLNLANIFNRESRDITIPYSESLENIHQITFDEEIEKALQQRNYRLAVRLLYLRTLKQLNDAELISWQLEKTNTAYLNELTDMSQRKSFGVLTRQFEYVWYGDFPIDSRSFQNISTLFHDFKTTMK